jgi:hypothetical protein
MTAVAPTATHPTAPEVEMTMPAEEKLRSKMAKDYRSIKGTRQQGEQMSHVTMQKIERE